MRDWTRTDWSEGTKPLNALGTTAISFQAFWIAYALGGALPAAYMLLVMLTSRGSQAQSVIHTLEFGGVYLSAAAFNLSLGYTSIIGSFQDLWNRAGLRADLPGTLKQFPVTVKYSRSGIGYGWDRGFVMFAEGSLVFQGVRSRFSLGNEVDLRLKTSAVSKRQCWLLEYTAEKEPYRISLNPDDAFRGLGADLREGFRLELDAWQNRLAGSSYDAICPPSQSHRESVRQAWVRAAGLAILTGSAAILSTVGLISYGRQPDRLWLPFAIVFYLFAFTFFFLGTAKWVRRWRRLRSWVKGTRYAEGYGGAALEKSVELSSPLQVEESPERLRLEH